MERQLRSWKVFLIRDAYCLFAIVVYVLATVFVLVNLCFGCAACGDCDAFLISERQIASISDAITALSRSHHQQWGRDDSRRKESIKLRSRRWGAFCTFRGRQKRWKVVTTYGLGLLGRWNNSRNQESPANRLGWRRCWSLTCKR